MASQGGSRNSKPVINTDSLRQAMDRLFSVETFSKVQFAERCTWQPHTLAAASLFWTWSDEDTLTERFATARTLTMAVFKTVEQLSSAYQPFMRMQCRWSNQVIDSLVETFRNRMEKNFPSRFRTHGWAIFAVDGSRFELPRTVSNENAFAPRDDNGKRKRRVRPEAERSPSDEKKSNSPQLWVTLMWHVASGLPWAWRRGESGSSERQHFQEMIPELPKKSLVVADAGFAGYSYWKSLIDAGHDFIIRVGANVTLLTQLGYVREARDCVYLWPDKAAADSQPPLVLRLVVVNKRRKKVVFVTSVRSSAALSKKAVIAIAKSRWGVELFFRSWKQTFDKRKLRSHKSEHALIELDWSLVGLWSVCLVAQLENRKLKPKKLSVAKILRAFRRPMRESATALRPGQELFERLSAAQIDSYTRKNKSSRNYPRKKKNKDKVGAPIIQKANSKQRKQAAMLKGKQKNAA